jgi:NTP pyrophosphatase (non-canonical NTP hydrolase)
MIEAAELNREFMWENKLSKPDIENVKEELADIMIYCLYMAEGYSIDIEKAIYDKIKKNAIKYPVTP